MQSMQKTVQSSVQSTVQSVRHLIDRNSTHDHTTPTNSNNNGDSEENATQRSPRLSFRKQGTNQNASPFQALRSSWRASNVHKKSRMPPKRSTIQQDPPKETPSTNISSTPQNDTDHSPLPSSVRSSLRHVRNALTLRMPIARATQQETVNSSDNKNSNPAEQPRREHHDSSSTTTEKHETPSSTVDYMPEEIPHAPTDEAIFVPQQHRRRPSILEHLSFGLGGANADFSYFSKPVALSVFQRHNQKQGDGTVADDDDDDEEEELNFTYPDSTTTRTAVPPPAFSIHKQTSSSTEESSSSRGSSERIGTVPHFPPHAALGSVAHCYSTPPCETFYIRGPDYLSSRKKVPSQDFLFPTRGMDIFLSTDAPGNVAANPHVLNGNLREVPSFVINFQVAWGNVIFYFAIPEKFVPYLRAGQEANAASSSSNSNISKKDYLRQVDASEKVLPSEKSLCRFLLQDEAHKTAVLKILPHVEQGPWVARMACQKPALIGKVIPIQYHYHAGDADRAPYLEADFNINSSSAAKPILQVARSCTKTLTLDLGFVIQGNTPDELPEQMLVGCRLHAIDPDSALAFPTEIDKPTRSISQNESPEEPPRSESTLPSYRSDSSESLEETAA